MTARAKPIPSTDVETAAVPADSSAPFAGGACVPAVDGTAAPAGRSGRRRQPDRRQPQLLLPIAGDLQRRQAQDTANRVRGLQFQPFQLGGPGDQQQRRAKLQQLIAGHLAQRHGEGRDVMRAAADDLGVVWRQARNWFEQQNLPGADPLLTMLAIDAALLADILQLYLRDDTPAEIRQAIAILKGGKP